VKTLKAPPRLRIFEPHAHMVARTTNDYEAMARAGIEVVV
jgi:predicted metal-dependent TIM-barrel fold hydrolase